MESMEHNGCCLPKNWKEPRVILAFLAIIILGAIIIVSILRDRINNSFESQITVIGRGEVAYQPDEAVIKLGVQIDKAISAQEALNKMNEKMNKIINSLKELKISEDDITNQNYSLYPQYDYRDGSSSVAGYNANQQVLVKVKDIDKNSQNLEQVISKAGEAGINQVLGISFKVSNVNDLKQQARIKAIQDAQSKAQELAKAAGIKKLGKVVSWYENLVSDSQNQSPTFEKSAVGLGGAGSFSPEIPTGDEKIVVEMGVNYEVK